MLLHEDALSVVAVGVADAVGALLDLAHLVETGVGNGLWRGGEHPGCRGGGIHVMGLGGGVEHCVGEDGLPVGGLGRHAAQGVIN